MNLRRGLFRLWLIGAALFVLVVAFASYSPIKREFDAVASMSKGEWPVQLAGFRQRYPQYNHLSDAQLMDAFYKNFYSDLTREEFDKRMAATSAIDPENFAQLEKVVADIKVPNPWASVGAAAAIAFGIPLAVLALGASLLWALSGFAVERQPGRSSQQSFCCSDDGCHTRA